MKNRILKSILLAAIISFGMVSCTDDDKLPVDFDELNVSGQPFAIETAADGLTSINKIDITNPSYSGFSKSYQLYSFDGGLDVTKVEVYVEFIGVNTTADEGKLLEIQSSAFDMTDGVPGFTINFVWSDVLTLLGLTLDDLEGGDNFFFRLAMTNSEGVWSYVSNNFDNQSADNTIISPVVCLNAPVPGDWELSMTDLWGDGWNGGQITVNIDGATSTYAAVGGGQTEIINIPDGTAIFTFTYSSGDWEGENLYTLTDPNGVVVLDEGVGDWSFSNGPTVGELLNACPD